LLSPGIIEIFNYFKELTKRERCMRMEGHTRRLCRNPDRDVPNSHFQDSEGRLENAARMMKNTEISNIEQGTAE
jgi:hypothetical protein